MFLLFNNLPMFSALVLSPSLATTPRRTGLLDLRWDFTLTSTGVS